MPEPEKRKAMCLHCGLEVFYAPGDEKDQARAWVALLKHDQDECPKNPLRARIAVLEGAIRNLDATDTAYRHTGLGDPAKAYSDLISLVQ